MAITKLNLTGGNAPFDPADPRTFPTGFSTFEDSVQTELDAVAATVAGDVTVQDDGVSQGTADTINFTGATVTVTGGVATVPLTESVGGTAVALTIVEVSTGVWSADAPAGRTSGEYPITFIPLDPDVPTDPADPTDGIDTPANIRDWDRLGPVTVGSL